MLHHQTWNRSSLYALPPDSLEASPLRERLFLFGERDAEHGRANGKT